MIAPDVLSACDRLDIVGACLAAVGELMVPNETLEIVGRDNLALLLDFLHQEHKAANEALEKALKGA